MKVFHIVMQEIFSSSEISIRWINGICCYEKVKGEISLFRDIVDLLKVFSMFLQLLAIISCLPALDMSAALVKDFVSVLRSETDKSEAVIDGSRGIQEARREWTVELVGVGLR